MANREIELFIKDFLKEIRGDSVELGPFCLDGFIRAAERQPRKIHIHARMHLRSAIKCRCIQRAEMKKPRIYGALRRFQ